KATAAAGAIMDVHTGELVAMVSVPDFDPERPSEALQPDRINRMTTGVYELGSAFKAFTTAMALDTGRIGVDTTFASRALDEGVFADYESGAAAAGDAAAYAIPGSSALTAIDYSDVCLNYDLGWFEESDLDAPSGFEDLADPAYAGLLSVTNPATSSPGLAFLLATVAEFGEDGWEDYWGSLAENDLRVTASWSDTYFTDFSVPNYGGDYPVVLSYASSPPSEVIDGEPSSAALLDTCFRQVEYAGVLEGAPNPVGGQAVIDWLLSDDFQASVPANMYVYPVSSTVEVPADWAEFAPLADDPHTLDPEAITAGRDGWIEAWTGIVLD
ncbi:thiamine ABC transporter substrate binding subunit, partial [uncultured Demequina sp.]|uniref:thiamine ABC transporter substrate-binding protein n=1 Tax=uncultured Demequina sp. TaxID=693499 RepID=UPI0025F8C519